MALRGQARVLVSYYTFSSVITGSGVLLLVVVVAAVVHVSARVNCAS
jgi:hypothetical protein